METALYGEQINFFYKDNNELVSIAHARGCELSLTVDTEEVHSRDHNSRWTYILPTKRHWSMTCESCLVMRDLNYMYEHIVVGARLYVTIGLVTDDVSEELSSSSWNTDEGFYGLAMITSIEIEAASNDIATMSIQLEGVTALKYGEYQDISHITTRIPSKQDPTFYFTEQSNSTTSKNKKLSDLTKFINEEEVPVRFYIDKIEKSNIHE